MNETYFEQLEETLYHEQLPNGLDVYILPKKGFSKTFVTFSTKYGSIDREFIPLGKTEPVIVPDGIAHFLEHKMFEKEEGDVFQQFSEKGASANAFTSFTKTTYLFSSTDHVLDNTKTLLDFVQQPYFTEETVEKEKGIIGQEITMYDDQPDWRLYFGAIENMYKDHPVKIDIAGTIESIDKITADHLYECYHTFYHPSNMTVFVVGAVNPQEMMDFIKQDQAAKTFEAPQEIQRFFPTEQTNVAFSERSLQMDVQKPKVIYGIKATNTDISGEEMLNFELAMQVAVELLFGRTSTFYQDVYEKGLIDESYSADFSMEKGYGFTMIGSDTVNAEQLVEKIKQSIQSFAKEGQFTEEDLKRVTRKKIGFFLRALNSIEYIANQFTRYSFNDMNLFDVVPALENLKLEQVMQALESLKDEQTHTVFTVVPFEKNGNE
ncbi:EF-P 5-aminopentanol modification-associated protein YfmH [Psychrobacillus lasiicapitis]|uniref:Insulinase family protein n=1 Tax=Psychrobacillus lasiicapitis TaxID=1636719 RepID=A0A544STA3_9BACI|nr:pitrilysin family protein [Psychrobacillus lasiicapitis]TQR08460.1 insulinase family protein [Psychrobacillus lasiicapitis]GGA15715.1 putative zinc protease YmfH [Psychrobacillus lasiicapitis]